MFWTAIMVVGIVAIVTGGVLELVKIGTRYSENIERIKHGYPALNGDTKKALTKREVKDGGYIDMTAEGAVEEEPRRN